MNVFGLFRILLVSLLLLNGAAFASSDPGGDFILTDHNGQPFNLRDYRGKVVLLFFGYTFCPDVCPTELATISSILNKLKNYNDQVLGVFVTVDPQRDTQEKLKEYVTFFSKDLVGLRGSPEEIETVKTAYRVKVQINRKNPDDQYYSVDHSANLYVVGQNGKLASIIPYGFPAKHVLEIVDQLLSE
jgi:cytochrome oxidase Cu insertion factor (SCO1/SenC/PrrC family)